MPPLCYLLGWNSISVASLTTVFVMGIGGKDFGFLGHILPTGLVMAYGVMAGRLWTTVPKVPTSLLMISISLGPSQSIWLARYLQEMLTRSKLSPPGYKNLILISLCWYTCLCATVEQYVNVSGDYVGV